MSEDKTKKEKTTQGADGEQLALDDARRVKVLSPSMLVLKRFLRNRLAIIGLVILIVMFAFAFIGGFFSPYSQVQVFKGEGSVTKDYATAKRNTEFLFTVKEGSSLSSAARSQIILALSSNKTSCTAEDTDYTIQSVGEDFYIIQASEKYGTVLAVGDKYTFTAEAGKDIPEDLRTAFKSAHAAGETTFAWNGETYSITGKGKKMDLGKSGDLAVASKDIIDANDNANTALVNSYDFRYACGMAFSNGQSSFEYGGNSYTLESDGATTLIKDASGDFFAGISDIKVETAANDIELSFEFKEAARDAVNAKQSEFTLADAEGNEVLYKISLVNANYYVKTLMQSELILRYAPPSWEHWLGTDNNGMDVLSRLMYGGRISLMVGFVVIFLEMLIGVIIGGISGYFGGKIDTIMMRFVDLFNSIPFWPMAIIVGSVMDSLKVSSMTRIFMLMALLGILGWTGIARVVRGQILTLREQDFMVATEATGIKIRRRIFKHLVPNVMPLLIVQATMGLGSIIITEATLSFLGLGVRYPLASWGSIINVANDIQIMTNCWFIWIPAGVLIVLSVLGFNFVGDGLRDAFDPKMKR